ncbi:hypothetical protein BO71DRAFT_402162 [Aspergillus ellipticus CBS 707.79]|uniref:Uncharacterized protein n=1 Tax=Aspergillus ellipticus CBS 707.79 TaxID=1448320 RepID=A0A319D0F3_9EURO|nr:hypothetical protein BO71DRAFT_402162 [Aspergillus ellipticus CBS 707.79]
MLTRRRPSLDHDKPTRQDFEELQSAVRKPRSGGKIRVAVMPIIENGGGVVDDSKISVGEGGYSFDNLAPFADGKIAETKPAYFYGTHPDQVDRWIRADRSKQIIPSLQNDRPILPNFFLEVKDDGTSQGILRLRACYNGAIGARAIHALRETTLETGENSYGDAYTITATYVYGRLTLYAHHYTLSKFGHPEYTMTYLGGWMLTESVERFKEGVTAYRNARDWAKDQREELIRKANARCQGQEDSS